MKFSTRTDIDAPIEHVFAELSDFQGFERSAMRRGAQIRRGDTQAAPGPGMAWEAAFPFRGKIREMRVELETYEAPTLMGFAGRSPGLTGFCEVELIALSPKKTRLRLALDLRPQTLSARLLIQSMKLAKSSLSKKFDARVEGYSRDIAARYGKVA